MLKEFDRPLPDEKTSTILLKTARRIGSLVAPMKLKVLIVLLTENWSLLQEVNQHRAELGYEPLPEQKVKF